MNILFIHNNFPAQFIHIAKYIAESKKNNVIFVSRHARGDINIPNVKNVQVKENPTFKAHNKAEKALLENFYNGETYIAEIIKVLKGGFRPDVIYDHPGWGCSMYIPDLLPNTPRISYFEWFYTKGAHFNFFAQGRPRNPSDFAALRQRNLCQLDALRECDIAITPTCWQHRQYPSEYMHKMRILHEGIDTTFFSPELSGDAIGDKTSKVIQGTDFSEMKEIVTYTARGFEPHRGFPQFYGSIPYILEARPECHVVIMGNDDVYYGEKRSDGKTWKEAMMEEIPVDSSRVHFLNYSSYHDYRKLLRMSSVHIYMTVPFVLSWSLLEAMSCGCLVVASDTEPVQEVIQHAKNGLMISFWDEKELSKTVVHALQNIKKFESIREQARRTIIEKYNAENTTAQSAQLINEVILRNYLAKSYVESTNNSI